MKHKIIFITSNKKDKYLGGQELYIKKLCEISDKFNINYSVVTPIPILNSDKQILLKLSKNKIILNIKSVYNIVHNNNPEIIISNDIYSELLINIIKFFYKKFIHINIVHDIFLSKFMKPVLKFKKILYLSISNFFKFNTDKHWYYSENLYLCNKNSVTEPNYLSPAINTKNFYIRKKKETFFFKNIGWIGNNDLYKKGFDIFCDISNHFINKNFYCAGITEKNTNIFKYNPGNIQIKGYYTNINNFIKQMDLIILPYRYEGFGLILPEIILTETPVIFSYIPSFNIIKFRTGYKVPQFNINKTEQCIDIINNYKFCTATLKTAAEKTKKIYSTKLLEKKYWQTLNNMLS